MKWLNYFKLQKLDWYIIKKFLGTYFFMLALIIVVIVVFYLEASYVRKAACLLFIDVDA